MVDCPYDPALAIRGAMPGADRETRKAAKSNGKAPFGYEWQKRASADPAKTKVWLKEAFEHFGLCPNIGALTGAYIPPVNGRRGG